MSEAAGHGRVGSAAGYFDSDERQDNDYFNRRFQSSLGQNVPLQYLDERDLVLMESVF